MIASFPLLPPPSSRYVVSRDEQKRFIYGYFSLAFIIRLFSLRSFTSYVFLHSRHEDRVSDARTSKWTLGTNFSIPFTASYLALRHFAFFLVFHSFSFFVHSFMTFFLVITFLYLYMHTLYIFITRGRIAEIHNHDGPINCRAFHSSFLSVLLLVLLMSRRGVS